MRSILRYGILMVMALASGPASAQKQYWGVAFGDDGPSGYRRGGIFRVDANAMGPELVVPFDTGQYIGWMADGSELLVASNGRIYGVTSTTEAYPFQGKLFWIDPVTDSLHVSVAFDSPQYPSFGYPSRWTSLMEWQPGILMGHTAGTVDRATIFKFFTATETIVQLAQFPSTLCGDGYFYNTQLVGTLVRGSDGYLYGASPYHRCKPQQVVKVDPVSGSVDYYDLGTNEGYPINGDKAIERNGKIHFSCFRGGPDNIEPDIAGKGTIISYDLATHAIVKEQDYTTDLHNPWNGWTVGPDGRWYGEVAGEPWVPFQELDQTLALYTYDPQQHTLEELADYGAYPGRELTGYRMFGGLLSASNGKLYGSFRNGLFEYDPVEDTLRLKAAMQRTDADGNVIGHGATGSMVEICRKPNYRPRSTTSFNVCAGSPFLYDLHNVNATGVVWRRNGNVIASQPDQRLAFNAIGEGDEGVWTCTLTNECGTTEPPPITITVNTGDFTTGTVGGDTLLCGTGDSAVLTGNTTGLWNTGATSPTLTVQQPGDYYVRYEQACGSSFSNVLHVAHLDSAQAPPLTDASGEQFHGDVYFCPGQEIVYGNNVEGPWHLYMPGTWSAGSAAGTTAPTTTVQDTGLYYVTVRNACNTDTSGAWHLLHTPAPPVPQLRFTDEFGQEVDPWLCSGDNVLLTVSIVDPPDPFASYRWTFPDQTTYFGTEPVTATQLGTYTVHQADCFIVDAEFTITLDDGPPDVPTILPDVDVLTGCDQDTVFLGTTAQNPLWTWSDAANVPQGSTAPQVQVDWHIGGGGFYSVYDRNGCGTSQGDAIHVAGTPAPDVTYTEALSILCLNDAPVTLSPGMPAGGTYSGAGVSGDQFDPVEAGLGAHAITYTFSNGDCTGYASDTLEVDICSGVVPQEDSGIRIAPNPMRDHLAIDSGKGTIVAYRLLDALGRSVSEGKVGAAHWVLERHGLPAGPYLLQLRSAERTVPLRIIME